MRILIADDEGLARVNLRCILEELDRSLELVEARDGAELVAQVRARRFDAAFVDIRMPNMSGLEAMRLLEREGRRLPWFVLSSHSEFNYAKDALALGASGYLLKPPAEDEVASALAGLVSVMKRESEARADRFSRDWTLLVLGASDVPFSLPPRSSTRGGLLMMDGLPTGTAGASLLREIVALARTRGRSFADDRLLVAAAIPPASAGEGAGGAATVEIVAAKEAEAEKPADCTVAASFWNGFAAAVSTALAAAAAAKAVETASGSEGTALRPPRIFALITADHPDLEKVRAELVLARKLLTFRAFLREGVTETAAAERILSVYASPDREAARALALLVDAARSGDSIAVRTRSAEALNRLSAATTHAKEMISRYLERTAGRDAARAAENGDLPALIAAFADRGLRSVTGDAKSRENDRIVAVEEYLRKRIASGDDRGRIALAGTAEVFGFTPNYLSALFHKKTGSTFVEFVTELRMGKARDLLEAGKSVKETAAAVGYSSARHFARLYRERWGSTPSDSKR